MKCLSIKQPWAAWIVLGAKDIENRTWQTDHWGLLLIHASATPDKHVYFEPLECGGQYLPDPRLAEIERATAAAGPELTRAAGTCGAIVGCVFMIGVTRRESLWFDGPFGWLLRNPVAFREPIPYKGRLSLFDVPTELVAEQIKVQGGRVT